MTTFQRRTFDRPAHAVTREIHRTEPVGVMPGAWVEWSARNVAGAAWIDEGAANGNSFAMSLRSTIDRRGALSVAQQAALERAVQRAVATSTLAKVEPGGVAKLERAFEAARSNQIQRPRLRLGDYVFSPAGENSANPGAIYVKDGNGEYVGKVVGGAFSPGGSCTTSMATDVIALASDPGAAARAYGQRVGACAACGRRLTAAESIDSFIGPVCAEKYGFLTGLLAA